MFVGGVPRTATEDMLREFAERAGPVSPRSDALQDLYFVLVSPCVPNSAPEYCVDKKHSYA